jgi:hypothetical protein
MRSALVIACMLLLGGGAPAAGVRQHFQNAPAQAQAAPPQRQDRAERNRQGTPRLDIRRGNTAVAGASAVGRRRAESHLPPGGPATDAMHLTGAQQGQPPQPGDRQLPEAVGLLLSLALLSGASAAPPPAISQREID